MKLKLCFVLVLLVGFLGNSQIIRGIVLDAKTKAPIETAAIYFDNTTFGVITNNKGEFTIEYTKAIQSPLIISFLGYKKQLITNYKKNNKLTILLKENNETLGEVTVNANDGLTRKEKLRIFRREFLGSSRFGKSCTILNEDALIINYIKKEGVLTAYSKVPLRITNKALQYNITYDLNSFILHFMPPNPNESIFNTKSVGFRGNSYYKNFKVFNKDKAIRNRRKAYAGSRLQFMRALYTQKFKEHKYQIYFKNTKVDPWENFDIEPKTNTEIKRVSLSQPLNILFNNWEKSRITFIIPEISLDFYGNYTDVDKVIFSGAMGDQRVGELLPFDYGL